jgi:hypothetical protein
MKKLILLSIALFALSTQSEAQIKYPFGAATFATLTVDNDTLTPSISNSVTYFTLSDTLVANTLIYATIASGVKAGDRLYFRSLNGATARSLTFKNTYFTAPVITTTASKTRLYAFVYDGSKFILVSNTQID